MALTKAGNIVLKYPHRKNLIINGNFDIWQRGTSFVGAAALAYSADRWRRVSINDSVVNIAAGSHNANLGSRYTKYALGVSVTTADTSIGAAQYEGQAYVIEGYDVQTIMGQTVTLSFWVYSSLPGTYCVSFRSIAPTYRSYIVEYTINQANTPEYKTITFTMDNGSVGTWDYENSTGLTIFFMLACGTSLHGTANSWQTANVIATSNQVNFLSATSRSFYLYQVQLELGPVATPFENRPFGEELALCQRYYYKTFNQSTTPGAAVGAYTGEHYFPITIATGTVYSPFFTFPTLMRGLPAITFYNPTQVNNDARNISSNSADLTSTTYYDRSERGVGIQGNSSSMTVGQLAGVHFIADAEL